MDTQSPVRSPGQARPSQASLGLRLASRMGRRRRKEVQTERVQVRERGKTHLAARSQLKSVNNKRERTANAQIG